MFTVTDGFTFFPAAMSATLTCWNARAWPTDDELGVLPPKVSALIPARNEAARIEACVRSALAALRDTDELIVCDDGSTDGTGQILASIHDSRLRVIPGAPLPAGWVGKPHACHQLSLAATGDWLVFLDADVTLRPDALQRAAAWMGRYDADVVTAFPHQRYGGVVEHVVLPFLPLTFTSWIPLDLIWRSPHPRWLVVSGQVLLFRRAAYDACGGFSAIRGELVDDVAICRNVKLAGKRLVFGALDRSAVCRMYDGPAALWEGFSKNLFEGLGESFVALAFALGLYFSAFVFPFVRAGYQASTVGALTWPVIGGMLANVITRAVLAPRTRQPLWPALLHPMGALFLMALAVNSARRTTTDGVQWRGRTYAARSRREPVLPKEEP